MHISVFVKISLLNNIHCKNQSKLINFKYYIGVTNSNIKNGFCNLLGNKGAAYISFKYKDMSFIFISAHLACNFIYNNLTSLKLFIKAGHFANNERNMDFQRIMREVKIIEDSNESNIIYLIITCRL